MKKKELLKFILTLLIFSMIGGCIGFKLGHVSHKDVIEEQKMEFARDTGYKQSCVEISYALGLLSDADYTSYIEASDKYNKEPNNKNLKNLSKLVNHLLKNLPIWDFLDDVESPV